MLPSSGGIATGDNGPIWAMRFKKEEKKKKEINILFRKHFVGAPWTMWMQLPLWKDTQTSVHQMILVIMSVILHMIYVSISHVHVSRPSSSKHSWIAFIISHQEDYTSVSEVLM